MTILRGHFAMMLIVAVPDGVEVDQLERALAAPAAALDLVLSVRLIDDDVPDSPPGEAWTVAVYGADQPGIVHRIATVLSEASVNIVDLTTRVIGDPDRPVYAMVLDVTVPPTTDADQLRAVLDGAAAELGIECTLHPSEADIL